MSEKQIQNSIRLALGQLDGVVLFRNNVGIASFDGRIVKYGLAPGSSDLIGICDGRFIALEIKTARGRVSDDQRMFLDLVRRSGGFAAVVRSEAEAVAAIERCRRGEKE